MDLTTKNINNLTYDFMIKNQTTIIKWEEKTTSFHIGSFHIECYPNKNFSIYPDGNNWVCKNCKNIDEVKKYLLEELGE